MMGAYSREAVGATLNLLHSESAASRSGRLFAGAPRAHSDSESGRGIFLLPAPGSHSDSERFRVGGAALDVASSLPHAAPDPRTCGGTDDEEGSVAWSDPDEAPRARGAPR